MHPSLLSLAFRRTLWPGFFLGGLALCWILWNVRPDTASELADWSRAPGVLRYNVWMTGLLIAGPLFIARAAGFGHRLARSDAAWCASRPTSKLSVLLSSWAGALLAACVWTSLLALVAEFSAGQSDRNSMQLLGSAEIATERGSQADVVTWTLEAPTHEDASVLRLPVGLIATGGPGAKVRARLSRSEGEAFTERELQIATNRPIEIQLPAGEGPLRLELERLGDGSLLLVPSKRAEWWRAVKSPATAPLLLVYLTILCAAVLLAWAMSLGVWMRPAPTTALLLTVGVALWFSSGDQGGWGSAMGHVANGDLPGPPTLRGAGLASAGVLLASVIGWWGLKWRPRS